MHAKQLIKMGLMTTALLGMAAQAVAQPGEGGHGGGGGNRGGWGGQRGGGMSGGSMTPRGMGENRPAPAMQAPQQSMPARNYQPQAPRSVERSNSQAGQAPQPQAPQQPRQGWSGDQGRSGNDWQRPAASDRQDGQNRDQYRRGWNNDQGNRPQGNWGQGNPGQPNQTRDRNWSNNDPNRNGVNGNRNWNAQSRDWNDRNRNPQMNGQYGAGRQDWGDRSGGRDWRYQPAQRLNDRDRWDGFRRWDNKDWRRDTRYNWQDYRRSHGSLYRLPSYYAPSGWYGGYSRFSIGIYLNNILFGSNYWINDPYSYRLPPAYGPLRWVRYYDDALLVDVRDGYVVDVIYDFFW